MESSSRLREVLEHLKHLKPTELKKVKAAADWHITNLDKKNTDGAPREFYECIVEVFKEHGVRLPPFYRLKSNAKFKSYKENFNTVELFMDEAFGDMTRVQRKYVYRICAALIHQRMRKYDQEMSLSKIIDKVAVVPSLFDQQFPGYAQNGVARILLNEGDGNEL